MFKEYLESILAGNELSRSQAAGALEMILQQEADAAQVGAFLMGMRMKGETASELAGFIDTMEKHMVRIKLKDENAIDVCGTGGDNSHSFNVSTTVAIIAAAGGATVAKHGNRSVSSKSGSADVLEALGIRIDLSPEQTKECLDKIGIGFLFAPLYHPAMKAVVPHRRSMKIRTFFNMLGPLLNPAGVKRQLIGAYDRDTAKRLAEVMAEKKCKKGCTVYSKDGFDEVSPFDTSYIFEVKSSVDGVLESEFNPPALNSKETSIPGGDSQKNAGIIVELLEGKPGIARTMAVYNAAFALYVADKVPTVGDGIDEAEELINSGAALNKLDEWREFGKQLAK